MRVSPIAIGSARNQVNCIIYRPKLNGKRLLEGLTGETILGATNLKLVI